MFFTSCLVEEAAYDKKSQPSVIIDLFLFAK